MKKIILIIFASLIFISLSYAGGDDRDQVLPLNSLNDEVDETPSFLQNDDSEKILSDEYKAEELELSNEINALAEKLNIKDDIEVNIQNKTNSLIDIKNKAKSFIDIDSKTESFVSLKSKAESFINKYLKSEQGLLVAAIIIVIGFILLLSFI
tara:strand:- start:188 stop:646 length:459 start_codon:yes stop_codon:yes gene_type:complete